MNVLTEQERRVTSISAIEAKALMLCEQSVRMTTAAGSGHPSSAASLAHIVAALMYRHLRFDPADPNASGADRLVLSEGHAVPAIYAAYADLGGVVTFPSGDRRALTIDDLKTLRAVDSPLDGHPNPPEGVPFFDAATGSLGMGLSVGAGLALAARVANIDKRIYVIIGDGESREGQIAEALDFVMDHNLANVLPIFNCNGQGQAGYVSKQQSPERLAAKLEAAGYDVRDIDGHNVAALSECFNAFAQTDRPMAMVARTIKGWGVSAMQQGNQHGKPLSADKLDAAVQELKAARAKLETIVIDPVPAPIPATPVSRTNAKPLAGFDDVMAAAGLSAAVEKNKLATRRAYGATLAALGDCNAAVVALDGDVSNSTFAEMFAKRHPDRFFECKIAEQNMISAAVGLAAGGFVPFASSFAKFLARAYDQVELASIGRANIKLVGSHAGVSLAADGPSQMSLPDVAYFRSFAHVDDGQGRPACVSFHPADAVAAYHMTRMMAEHEGMCYMRTHRPDVAMVYDANTAFTVGGSHTLREGDALTIVSAGYMVTVCLAAAERLAKDGVKCAVIDAYSFPLDTAPVLASGRSTGGRILVVEDNYAGGLNAEVAEAAAEAGDVRVASMVCRRIPRSARTADNELAYLGLSTDDICRRAAAFAKG